VSLTARFSEAIEALTGPEASGPFGVAVSGGGDSVALLALAAEWATARGVVLHAVTVDHGLRPEAAGEAAEVGRQAAALGLSHETLKWDGWDGRGNLQAAARAARYRLLADWAARRGVTSVLLGHTQDDNVESFVMGLMRGAGLDGLSGMRPRFSRGEVAFLRPLLGQSRTGLRAYLRRGGLGWIEDPSNEDERFDRVRIRKALLAAGVDQAKIAESILNLRRTRAGIDAVLARWAEAHVREDRGELVIAPEAFAALPGELARRLLNAALRWVSGADYPPRADPVMRLVDGAWPARGRTLHGCVLRAERRGLVIGREPSAAAAAPRAATDAVWDGRWVLEGPHGPGLEIRALGPEGLKLCPGWREAGGSRAALLVSPAVWRGPRLVAAPLAGHGEGWRARIARSFAASFTLH